MQFVKPGASLSDFDRDKAICEAQLQAQVSLGGASPNAQIGYLLVSGRDHLKACLMDRGWREHVPPTPEEDRAQIDAAEKAYVPPSQRTDDNPHTIR